MDGATLRRSEAYFRAIAGGSLEAYLAVGLQGKIIVFSPAAEALFSLPAQAVLGRYIEDAGLPEQLRASIAEFVYRAKAGDAVARKSFEIESLSGSTQHVAAEIDVYSAGTGHETLIVAHLHDLTKQRLAEKKAQRLDQILRTMSAGNQAMARAATEDELYREMCRVTVELGGYRMAWIGLVEQDDACTMRPVAFAGHEDGYLSQVKISWGDNPYGHGPSGKSVRGGVPEFNNDVTSNPDMEPWREPALKRGYRSSLSLPLKDKGMVFGGLTIYASEANAFGPEELALLVELAENVSFGIVTLRVRRAHEEMEKALRHAQKLEAIGQMAGGIAHDFNNVLQIVESAARLMRRRPDDAALREKAIESILCASGRASSITRHLLAFSRRDALKAETVVPSLEALKWRNLMKSSTHENVRVEVEIPMWTWAIYCDPGSLEMALINLAVNARDAMPGGGTLTVSTSNVSTGNRDFVAIVMSDTGCGIDANSLTRVFEPFFSTKPAGKGTGLGLSQVYGFATQSGGDVRIASQPGRGTKVTLLLPRSLEAGPVRPPETSEPFALDLHLLVVDDNLEVALAVQNMATALGCRVTVADTPAKALGDLEAGEFDILLTDIVMPGLSGLELAGAARERHRALGIILMSGYSEALGKAALDYKLLRKPFTAADLEEALRRTQAAQAISSAG